MTCFGKNIIFTYNYFCFFKFYLRVIKTSNTKKQIKKYFVSIKSMIHDFLFYKAGTGVYCVRKFECILPFANILFLRHDLLQPLSQIYSQKCIIKFVIVLILILLYFTIYGAENKIFSVFCLISYV